MMAKERQYVSQVNLPDSHKVNMWVLNPQWAAYTWNALHPTLQPYWDWLEEHATGDFDCTLPEASGKVTWLFEKEEDVTFFLLRWK